MLLLVPGYSRNDDDWSISILRHLVQYLSQRHEVTVLAIRYLYKSAEYEVKGVRVISVGAAEKRGFRQVPSWLNVFRIFAGSIGVDRSISSMLFGI